MSKPSVSGTSPDPSPRNDRAVYRVVYPVSYPTTLIPHVLLDGESNAVPLLDCSEHGIRYRIVSGDTLALGTPVSGEVQREDRPPLSFSGHLVRVEPGEVAVRLDPPGLPFSLLLAEQRAVLLWGRTRADHEDT